LELKIEIEIENWKLKNWNVQKVTKTYLSSCLKILKFKIQKLKWPKSNKNVSIFVFKNIEIIININIKKDIRQ
jgi:hypothetical protein